MLTTPFKSRKHCFKNPNFVALLKRAIEIGGKVATVCADGYIP